MRGCVQKGEREAGTNKTEGELCARPAHLANPKRKPIPSPMGCEMCE